MVLSFQHKLIQEYLAAVYIAEHVKQDATSTFLKDTFPTWEEIKTHREVVQFTCGLSSDTDAHTIVNHIAQISANHVHNDLNDGKLSIDSSIVKSCQKEGGLSALNPYFAEYPSCGCPLAEVLANTELAYITGVNKNDTLRLSPSRAKIIVYLHSRSLHEMRSDIYMHYSLWDALYAISANVIALHIEVSNGIRNLKKLSRFPNLKFLQMRHSSNSEADGYDIAQSIEAWGPEPQLTYCQLSGLAACMSWVGLCKCVHLRNLSLQWSNLHDKLSIFMASPPLALRRLKLHKCSLQGGDVDHITQAIREGRLTQLEDLDIVNNPVGEVAVSHLLEALISIRPHTSFTLHLEETGVDEHGEHTPLSDQFEKEWKAKLTNTNIKVKWTDLWFE